MKSKAYNLRDRGGFLKATIRIKDADIAEAKEYVKSLGGSLSEVLGSSKNESFTYNH